VLKLFWDIMLLRAQPRDVPASPAILVLAAVAYFATSVLQSRLLFGADLSLSRGVLDLGLTFVLFGGALAVRARSHRFTQTLTALLATGTMVSVPMIGLIILRAGLPEEHPLVIVLSLVSLPLLAWYLVVVARIVRLALDVSMFTGMAVAMTYVLLGYLFVEQLPSQVAG
jgi:hypothetical protein